MNKVYVSGKFLSTFCGKIYEHFVFEGQLLQIRVTIAAMLGEVLRNGTKIEANANRYSLSEKSLPVNTDHGWM